MNNVNPLTTVSLMLTLAGLLGTFFNIQLSQWLRDLMALYQKAYLDAGHGSQPQSRFTLECKVELAKLVNWPSILVSLSIVAMVSAALVNGLLMVRSAANDPMYPHIWWALTIFLGYFVLISGFLLVKGAGLNAKIRSLIYPKSETTTAR